MYVRIIDALNARFASRFTPDGEDFAYRQAPDAQPTRVTARGHRMLLDGFQDRTGWWITGVLVACGILAIYVYIGLASPVPAARQDIIEFAVIPVVLPFAIFAGWVDLWDYPQRTLFRGLIERNQIQRRWFRNWGYETTWLSLVWAVAFATHISLRRSDSDFSFWGFIGAIVLGISAYTAIQKLRLRNAPLLPQIG